MKKGMSLFDCLMATAILSLLSILLNPAAALAADPDAAFRNALRSVVDTNGNVRTAALDADLQALAVNNGGSLTNIQDAALSAALQALAASNGGSLTNIPNAALDADLQALAGNNGGSLTNIPAASITPAGSTRAFTNVVWDAGATTGKWTFVDGRLTAIE